MQNQLKQPYPWLEAFGFRIADRINTLEANGRWSFKRSDGRAVVDTKSVGVGTRNGEDGEDEEEWWPDSAIEETERLQQNNLAMSTDNAAMRGENKMLREEIQALRRQLAEAERKQKVVEKQKEVVEKEKEVLRVQRQEDHEKMEVGDRCPSTIPVARCHHAW